MVRLVRINEHSIHCHFSQKLTKKMDSKQIIIQIVIKLQIVINGSKSQI